MPFPIKIGKHGSAWFTGRLPLPFIIFLCKLNNGNSSLSLIHRLPSHWTPSPFTSPPVEMGKKPVEKGKQTAAMKEVVTEGSKRAAELNKKWRGDVVFLPSNLDGSALQARYRYLWGRPVPKGHGAPKVLAEGKQDPPDSY